MAASKHEQTPITSIDRGPVGAPVGSAESVPTCTVTYAHHPHLIVTDTMRSITDAPMCEGIES